MSKKARVRALCAVALVAFLLLGSVVNKRLWSWLSVKTTDELYGLLNCALWAVIIGVFIEELQLLWKGMKFVHLVWRGELKSALSKLWLHKGEISEGVGFVILIAGLAGELALGPQIETRQKQIEAAAAHDLELQKGKTADALVVAGAANDRAAVANAEAGRANERAAALEKHAADSQRDAEYARIEQERLKSVVNWRVISPDSARMIAKELSYSHGSVTLRYVAVDPEAVFLTVQLSRIFAEANRLAETTMWVIETDAHVYSNQVALLLHIPDRENDATSAISRALSVAGIPFSTDDVFEHHVISMSVAGLIFGQTSVSTDALIIVGSKLPPM